MSNLVKSSWRLVVYDFQALYPFLAEAPFYCQFGRGGLILLAISERRLCVSHSQFCKTMSLVRVYFKGQLGPDPQNIPAPSHCRVLHEKYCSLHNMLLAYLLFNRHHFVGRNLGGGRKFLYLCPKQ